MSREDEALDLYSCNLYWHLNIVVVVVVVVLWRPLHQRYQYNVVCFPHGATVSSRPRPPQYPGSVELLWTSDQPDERTVPDSTQHSQETDIYAPPGLEHIIPASERPQTHVLDRTATVIGHNVIQFCSIHVFISPTENMDKESALANRLNNLFAC
jgi:hypothetical protein